MCLPKEYENTNCSRRRFPELVASISQSIKLSLCSEQLDGLPSEDLLTHGHRANVSQFAFPNPLGKHILYIASMIFTFPRNAAHPHLHPPSGSTQSSTGLGVGRGQGAQNS